MTDWNAVSISIKKQIKFFHKKSHRHSQILISHLWDFANEFSDHKNTTAPLLPQDSIKTTNLHRNVGNKRWVSIPKKLLVWKPPKWLLLAWRQQRTVWNSWRRSQNSHWWKIKCEDCLLCAWCVWHRFQRFSRTWNGEAERVRSWALSRHCGRATIGFSVVGLSRLQQTWTRRQMWETSSCNWDRLQWPVTRATIGGEIRHLLWGQKPLIFGELAHEVEVGRYEGTSLFDEVVSLVQRQMTAVHEICNADGWRTAYTGEAVDEHLATRQTNALYRTEQITSHLHSNKHCP